MSVSSETNPSETTTASGFFELLAAHAHGSIPEQSGAKTCLITREPCSENAITLSCGHVFEYIALYKDLFARKISQGRICNPETGDYMTQCPYCRTICSGVIPFRKLDGVMRVVAVNSPSSQEMDSELKCKHVFRSGKRRGCECAVSATARDGGVWCGRHGPANK
jgi:hypothetical protein